MTPIEEQQGRQAAAPGAPPKRGRAAGCAIVALVGFGAVLLAGLAGSLLPKSESDQARARQVEACTAAHVFVKHRLRSPAAAEFPSCSETAATEQGGIWTISGTVDAQNGFGAKIRSSWTVSAMRGSDGRWVAANVQLQGN